MRTAGDRRVWMLMIMMISNIYLGNSVKSIMKIIINSDKNNILQLTEACLVAILSLFVILWFMLPVTFNDINSLRMKFWWPYYYFQKSYWCLCYNTNFSVLQNYCIWYYSNMIFSLTFTLSKFLSSNLFIITIFLLKISP